MTVDIVRAVFAIDDDDGAVGTFDESAAERKGGTSVIGGRKDVLSTSPVRKSCYDCVSGLNRRHMLWAWISMFYVGFVDLYIRLCAQGVWTDWRIF